MSSAPGLSVRTGRGTKAFVATALVIQISIPAFMFGARWVREGSNPASEYPLSWQMYSAVPSGVYVGVMATGREVDLETSTLLPVVRAVRYGDTVQLMLCEADPDLISVQRILRGVPEVPVEC